MDKTLITGVEITPLKQIRLEKGDLFHGLKRNEPNFKGFGEIYFSFIKSNEIKAWKKHDIMVCNFIVPVGKVKFVIYDPRKDSPTRHQINEIILSPEEYFRLTIPFDLWYGFKGESATNSLVVNIANIEHNPEEQKTKDYHDQDIPYLW